MASFFCGRGSAHVLSLRLGATPSLRCAGADKIALDIGKPAGVPQHQGPALVPVSAHGSARERNWAWASTAALPPDAASALVGRHRIAVSFKRVAY